MATINHLRLNRLNPAIARECEGGHAVRALDHAYGAPLPPSIDPYTRRSNVCPSCHTTRALGSGDCLC
jgi:hypothetical protein